MKWRKVKRGGQLILKSNKGDYLFHVDESSVNWEEMLCNLYSIAYVDDVAVNVYNICSGTEEARTRDYYENGDWYYLPFPDGLRQQFSLPNIAALANKQA